MDQNQDNIDSDLQKAIDDITNTETGEVVFDDPVAAPSLETKDGDNATSEAASFEETPFEPMPELGVPPMPIVGDGMTPMPDFSAEASEPIAAESHGDTDVRGEALRDLIPLLDKMNLDAKKKFELCKMAFEDFGDPTMLEQALKAAKAIADDNDRGQALLYIVEAR